MLQVLKVRLCGASQMILHNGQTANPLNKFAKQLKAVSRKKNKTEDDMEELAKIEFLAGWDQNPAGAYTPPAHNIEAKMQGGAKENKKGKLIQSGALGVDDPT